MSLGVPENPTDLNLIFQAGCWEIPEISTERIFQSIETPLGWQGVLCIGSFDKQKEDGDEHINITAPKTNMTVEKTTGLKMYLLSLTW